MQWILAIYVLLGIYHFFMIWWRNRTFKPEHSYFYGTSYLEVLVAGAMDLVNLIMLPVIRLLMLLLPKSEKEK